MTHDPVELVPFTMAGLVESWNRDTRVVYIGGARLEISPGVAVRRSYRMPLSLSRANVRNVTAGPGS
jgi:hypothetical protein